MFRRFKKDFGDPRQDNPTPPTNTFLLVTLQPDPQRYYVLTLGFGFNYFLCFINQIFMDEFFYSPYIDPQQLVSEPLV